MWLLLAAGCDIVGGVDRDFENVLPAGWQGPFELSESSVEPAMCPAGSSEVSLLHAQLSSPGCTCSPLATACQPSFSILPPGAANCNVLPSAQFSMEHSVCTEVDLFEQYARVGKIDNGENGCGGTPEPPLWGLNTRVCSVDNAGSCIIRDGDIPCPEGPFTERVVRFAAYADARACDCGTVNEACGGTVQLFNDVPGDPTTPPCAGLATGPPQALDLCLGVVTARYAKFERTPAELSCTSNGADAETGTLTPENPVTICCIPEGT